MVHVVHQVSVVVFPNCLNLTTVFAKWPLKNSHVAELSESVVFVSVCISVSASNMIGAEVADQHFA